MRGRQSKTQQIEYRIKAIKDREEKQNFKLIPLIVKVTTEREDITK